MINSRCENPVAIPSVSRSENDPPGGVFSHIPLVNIQKTMENHHFQWVNPLFLWPFSIAMLVYQRVTHTIWIHQRWQRGILDFYGNFFGWENHGLPKKMVDISIVGGNKKELLFNSVVPSVEIS